MALRLNPISNNPRLPKIRSHNTMNFPSPGVVERNSSSALRRARSVNPIGFPCRSRIHRKWNCAVLMKRSILAFLFIAFSSAAFVSAHGQVVPSATERVFNVRAGALFSAFQPDYAGEGVAQTSPNRLYGIGGYVDARFSRWVQPEFEVRFLRFNEYLGIDENTYSIGERVPIMTFRKFTPYGKVLAGIGNGSFLNGSSFVLTFGGGVDYRLSRKFTIRCADFEYQQWHVTPTLWPYGLSAGLSYKIF